MDDFKDKIVDSDEEFYTDKKGNLNDDIVNDLHFGAGDENQNAGDAKKSREERH
jgi:hypothetical protein